MARRKVRRARPARKGFGKGLAVAGVKTLGSTGLGAICGTTKVLAGETPAKIAKVGMLGAGIVSDMYLDKEAHPVVASLGDAALYGPSFSAGEEGAEYGVRKLIEARRESQRKEDLEELRRDLSEQFDFPEATVGTQKRNGVAKGEPESVPVPKERQAQHPPPQE